MNTAIVQHLGLLLRLLGIMCLLPKQRDPSQLPCLLTYLRIPQKQLQYTDRKTDSDAFKQTREEATTLVRWYAWRKWRRKRQPNRGR